MKSKNETRLAAIPGGQMGGPASGPTGGDYNPIVPQGADIRQTVQAADLRRRAAALLAEASAWLDIAAALDGGAS